MGRNQLCDKVHRGCARDAGGRRCILSLRRGESNRLCQPVYRTQLPRHRGGRPIRVRRLRACSPTPENIVSGQLGDALVVTKALSGANSYYIVVDRAAFGEAVQVVNDNPGDPGLTVASSVLAAFAGIDRAAVDVCRDSGVLAIAFETDGPVPDFGPIEVQLQALQQALDELSTVASAVKKEATNFIFEELFCPGVEDIAGGDTVGAQIRGAVVASLFGC